MVTVNLCSANCFSCPRTWNSHNWTHGTFNITISQYTCNECWQLQPIRLTYYKIALSVTQSIL